MKFIILSIALKANNNWKFKSKILKIIPSYSEKSHKRFADFFPKNSPKLAGRCVSELRIRNTNVSKSQKLSNSKLFICFKAQDNFFIKLENSNFNL